MANISNIFNLMTKYLVFSALLQFSQFFFQISNFFSLSTTEETFKSSRNVHLVHQNWYPISFTSHKFCMNYRPDNGTEKDIRIYQGWGPVPRGSKHALSTGYIIHESGKQNNSQSNSMC
jgi:hypothetical protein